MKTIKDKSCDGQAARFCNFFTCRYVNSELIMHMQCNYDYVWQFLHKIGNSICFISNLAAAYTEASFLVSQNMTFLFKKIRSLL